MSASLQMATQFFFDNFGHCIADGVSNLSRGVEAHADVTCSFCGRRGVGVRDGRNNHLAYPNKCLPCWSLYQPSPDYFVGGGKDYSFTGKVKSNWIVDSRGATIYVAPQTFEAKAPNKRVTPGLRYVVGALPIRDILNGDAKPPFLWGHFGEKKEQSIEILELTSSLSRIVFCDGKNGKRLYYDIEHVQMGIASIEPLSKEQRNDPGIRQWLKGDDIYGKKTLFETKKGLRRLGLDPSLLRLSLGERHIIDVLVDHTPDNQHDLLKCVG
jgi:hypothetical protein